ncbi:MAG: hypothetical protein ACI9FU_001789, partial [Granulosicoccus sp.]
MKTSRISTLRQENGELFRDRKAEITSRCEPQAPLQQSLDNLK